MRASQGGLFGAERVDPFTGEGARGASQSGVAVRLSLIPNRLGRVAAVNAALLQAGLKDEAAVFLGGCAGLDSDGVVRRAAAFVLVE